MFDLFMDYWARKKKDPNTHLNCINKETYYEIIVGEDKIPMPASYIPFPDLVEVYIAEIMLGRELTDLEKEGSRFIPKISEEGDHYFASLTWITYPHSYMTLKPTEVTYNEDGPAPVIFEIEDIRGIYSNRKGDVLDE